MARIHVYLRIVGALQTAAALAFDLMSTDAGDLLAPELHREIMRLLNLPSLQAVISPPQDERYEHGDERRG